MGADRAHPGRLKHLHLACSAWCSPRFWLHQGSDPGLWQPRTCPGSFSSAGLGSTSLPLPGVGGWQSRAGPVPSPLTRIGVPGRTPALGALVRLGAAMRDVLGAGSLRSLVQLAWMCLFSSVPVRAGLGPGAAGLAQPGSDLCGAAPSRLRAGFLHVPAVHGGSRGAGGSDPALGLQHGGAKVLEKTFEEWLRYRDECLRRMASEPYPAGTRPCPARGQQSRGWGLSLLQHPLLCHPRRVSQGTDKDLHISDGTPRAGMSWGAEAGVGHPGPFQSGISPLTAAGIAGFDLCQQRLTIGFPCPCPWKGSSVTGHLTCTPAGPTGAPAPPSTSPAPSTCPGLRKVRIPSCHPGAGSQG